MILEDLVNKSNHTYQTKGMAAVVKIPTSWKVIWKNYKGYRKPLNAFPEHKAWLDYIGVIEGVPVTFDAKETTNKTSFPLSNIKEHQIRDMKIWHSCGGVAFLIVWFKQQNEFYLLPYHLLIQMWNHSMNGGRKSIPYKQFQKEAIQITSGNHTYLDWLTAYHTYRGVS